MKQQIRRGVFETNSSTTHSLTMMMKDEYDRWTKEELYLFDGYSNWFPKDCCPKVGSLYTRDEVIEFLKAYDKKYDHGISDYEDEDIFYEARTNNDFKLADDENEYLEDYYKEFTTPNGDTVVAFGEYGNEY